LPTVFAAHSRFGQGGALGVGPRRDRRRRRAFAGLYFSVFYPETDGGVMITGSHNPAEDNGFKIVSGRSMIYGAEIQKLRSRVEARVVRPCDKVGTATDHDILVDYVDYV